MFHPFNARSTHSPTPVQSTRSSTTIVMIAFFILFQASLIKEPNQEPKPCVLAPEVKDVVFPKEAMVVLRAVVSTVVGMQGTSWLRRLPMVVVCLALIDWPEVRGVPVNYISGNFNEENKNG